MKTLDPRDVALRHPWAAVALFGLLWGVAGYGNVVVRKGAILEHPIVNAEDPYQRMDEAVDREVAAGFRGQGQAVPIVLRFPNGIRARDDVLRIQRVSRDAARVLGFPVLSLATAPRYADEGGAISTDPYIPEEVPADFDVAGWKAQVRDDPSVYPALVGRDFDSAIVSLFVPPGDKEVPTFRRIVEFLEDRTIPWWEWLFKDDVVAPPDMGVAGTLVATGLIDQSMNVDVFTLVTLGIGLTLPVFVISLGGWRPALLAVGVVVASGVLWTRGALGILQVLGIDLEERVYFLAAYANCIVQGVSFALHKYECFEDGPNGAVARRQAWARAQSVDGLIGFTALVAVLGFATLYSFQVRAIRDFGMVSALGVAIVLFNACVLLPALDLALGRGARRPAALAVPVDRSIARLARLAARLRPWPCIAGLLALMLGVGWLVGPAGKLAVWTDPLAFVRGTVVDETSAYLRQPGRIGSPMLDLLVQPQGAATVRNPEFLGRAVAFAEAIRGLPEVREVTSILSSVGRISQVSLGMPLPRTLEESAAVFLLLESGMSRDLTTRLYYPGGVRASVHLLDDRSDRLGVFRDELLAMAHREFPELTVQAYGELSLYPQWDRYIRVGKPLNVISSQWVVIVLCMLRIAWHNRRQRQGARLHPFWGGVVASTPFVLATAVVALEMIGFAVPLDAATAATTALAISAAIDFAIYLLDDFQAGLRQSGDAASAAEQAVRRKGRIILTDMLLNAVCFMPLLLSHFQPVAQVGWIMPSMLLACSAGTLLLMAALLPAAVRSPRPVVAVVTRGPTSLSA